MSDVIRLKNDTIEKLEQYRLYMMNVYNSSVQVDMRERFKSMSYSDLIVSIVDSYYYLHINDDQV